MQCANGLFLLRVSLIIIIIQIDINNGYFSIDSIEIFLKHLVNTGGESIINALGIDDLWLLSKGLIDFIIDHAVTENTCIFSL